VARFQPSPEQRSAWRAEIRGALGLGDEDFVVLTVARLTRDKGHYEVLRALRQVVDEDPQVRLLLAGDGPEAEGLRREIERLALQDQVLLLGWRQDVPALLCAAEVLLLASHREGMPVATMEAMAAGLPVVATDIPGCREQVLPGETGYLVPVADVEGIARALLALRRDPRLRRLMGERAQQAAVRFDVANVVRLQTQLYTRLLTEYTHAAAAEPPRDRR
jgi:glycosyltransferase involved in cell wall biosynthesis